MDIAMLLDVDRLGGPPSPMLLYPDEEKAPSPAISSAARPASERFGIDMGSTETIGEPRRLISPLWDEPTHDFTATHSPTEASYQSTTKTPVHGPSVISGTSEESPWRMFLSNSNSGTFDSLGLYEPLPELPGRLSLSYPGHVESHPSPSPASLAFASTIRNPRDASPGPSAPVSDIFGHSRLQASRALESENIVDEYLRQTHLDNASTTTSISGPMFASMMNPGYTYQSSSEMAYRRSGGLGPPGSASSSATMASTRPPAYSLPRRGLSGWSDPTNPPLSLHPLNGDADRLQLPANYDDLERLESATSSNNNSNESLLTRRSIRTPSPPRPATRSGKGKGYAPSEFNHESEGDEEGDSDSDGEDEYRPSRTPSPRQSRSRSPTTMYAYEFQDEPRNTKSNKSTTNAPRKGKGRPRSKGKARGSAALALAVVTQLGAGRRRSGSEGIEVADELVDPAVLYREGSLPATRKRKNASIPLPIPIPNLNKKSRGRKVPFVANLPAGPSSSAAGGVSPSVDDDALDDDDDEGTVDDSSTVGTFTRASRKRRKMRPTSPSVEESSSGRTYVCVVPGCGKCFVRGEHLKRHVRSIHTHDKPHRCPYEGCDKSFSRRDNLGQHVRVHLQQAS